MHGPPSSAGNFGPPFRGGPSFQGGPPCHGGLRRSCWEALDGPTGRRLVQLAAGAVAVGLGLKLYSRYKRQQRRQRWQQEGKDVVVLHTFPRATSCPNMSPFALKIETYCRMAGIAYVIDTEEPMGSKNKSPWITINGEEVQDSELILDYLEKHFNRPLVATAKLSPEQHATGRLVQVMLDEHAMGCMAMKRYIIDRMEYVRTIVPEKMKRMVTVYRIFFSASMKKAMYIKGVGRFTEQEVLFFLYRDLQALADILGKKPFLLGSEATAYDAAAFASLTQALCATAPEVELQVRQKHDNLVQYFDRMKAKFWSDWDQLCEK
ncbi:failed axon connections homolog [Pollicipes pollicipes]|uniref:failed axon connections homolog n=1 Tax=Pollicipes pollicipes TaxID=41117 RepID=UPI001885112A|nr:failed axon connections homolog [Pollicipes pollicipes]